MTASPFPTSGRLAPADPPSRLDGLEWRTDTGLTPYATALAEMEARAAAVTAGDARELIWLLEHPPVYTAGTSADPVDLVDPRFPVFDTGRGGKYTYHGPGQRIGYLVLDLGRRGRDVRRFVHAVEDWVIAALGEVGVAAFSVEGRVGIWTRDPNLGGREAKIGAIGVRVKRWVTLHGFAVNIDPDLTHFGGIVPCGLAEYPVTSLKSLGTKVDMATFDAALTLTSGVFLETLSLAQENEA
ncbi:MULTISPECIES: lipoyl(octanoyl) transferase LipB [Sphingomonas]|uniref:lipoyl(octanoyl) transferase LipB n=1 Tax=Sphingomonas TaxID=13687 RepID=UPI0021BC93A3|nr:MULTISPECIES: lipoyl(octanoyl) transferase LipB [Sphingomonas]MDY0968032.1 lipoyl(octanoyl) transferase LipB [Sphingomonas sp. CFBP9021]